jgi:hypothetical protein
MRHRQASFAGFMKSIYIGDVSSCAPRMRKAQHGSRGGVPRLLPERQLRRFETVRRRTTQGEGFKTAKREAQSTRQSIAAPAPAAAVDGPIRY